MKRDYWMTIAIAVAIQAAPDAFGAGPAGRQKPSERTGREVVEAQCTKCHAQGLNGAPRIGDRAAWIDRARLGLDALVLAAIRGHDGMPSRGGMAALTDTEMRAAVIYMFRESNKVPPS